MSKQGDNSSDSDRGLIEVYRKMPFHLKWKLMGKLYQDERVRHDAEFLQAHPGATAEMILDDWKRITWGEKLFQEVKAWERERQGKSDASESGG